MKVLRFKLSGNTAFFKKPDVNAYCYFTYNSIHKIALIGILGAIMGFEGYNQQNNRRKLNKGIKVDDKYPEFYEKLKDLSIAIVPINNEDFSNGVGYRTFDGYVNKKIQVFNNSVGYASQEEGGNLIVKEQWIEKPIWDIYINLNHELGEVLSNRIMNYNFEYIPYLGKNDHYANIDNVEIIDDINLVNYKEVQSIYGLFKSEEYIIDNYIDDDDDDEDFENEDLANIVQWRYEEFLPIGLTERVNQYKKESFRATSMKVKYVKGSSEIYNIKGKNIFFF